MKTEIIEYKDVKIIKSKDYYWVFSIPFKTLKQAKTNIDEQEG